MYEATVEAVRKNKASLWEIADMLVAETPTENPHEAIEKASIIIKALTGEDYAPKTLRTYHRTAQIFPVGTRRASVSFTGHAEIASTPMTENQAREWLEKAATHGWSKREIREQLGYRVSERDRVHLDKLTPEQVKTVVQSNPEVAGAAVSDILDAAMSYERTTRERAGAYERTRQDVVTHQRKTMGDERTTDVTVNVATAAENAAKALIYAQRLDSYQRHGAFETMSQEELDELTTTIVTELAEKWEAAAQSVRETVIRARAAQAAFTI